MAPQGYDRAVTVQALEGYLSRYYFLVQDLCSYATLQQFLRRFLCGVIYYCPAPSRGMLEMWFDRLVFLRLFRRGRI